VRWAKDGWSTEKGWSAVGRVGKHPRGVLADLSLEDDWMICKLRKSGRTSHWLREAPEQRHRDMKLF
jgi:hypothetical protein